MGWRNWITTGWKWLTEPYPPECGGRAPIVEGEGGQAAAAETPREQSGCRYADGRPAKMGEVVAGRPHNEPWVADTVMRTYPDGAIDLAYVELVPIERMVGKEVRLVDLRNGRWPAVGGPRVVAMVTRIRTYLARDFRRVGDDGHT